MKIKEFYESMKDVVQSPVTIMNGVVQEYSDYMRDVKVYEYLFEYKIKSVYVGKNDHIIVEISE